MPLFCHYNMESGITIRNNKARDSVQYADIK